jgi:flagellar hook assembly protein FlgD
VRWIDGSTEENKPTIFNLSQNYPNPFNPVTNFKFSLPQASHVKIEIFNILGQKVKTLVDEDMKAGSFVVDWDGEDQRGVEVSSGIYFYRMIADDFSTVKRMVLLK